MTPGFRKLLLILLLIAGCAAALRVDSVGRSMIAQLRLLPVVIILTLMRPTRASMLRWLDRLRQPTTRTQARAAVWIALAACAYLLFTGFFQQRDLFPRYHDENMHLVQMQMIARGMLWRGPHPLADAFETFHVLTEPVYASIYFPGTAMLYAPAVWLGLPWWLLPLLAAGASVGLLYHNVTDLLDGAYGALAALLMISASQFRYLSLIVMSHTVMILLGMAMLWAYLRWRREQRPGWALVIGVISGWAAITRPVDAICWAAPIGVAILMDLRGLPTRRWLTTAALIVAGAAPLLAIQVTLNYGVTGNPLLTPYRFFADRFLPQISFGFHDYDPTVRPQTKLLQKIVYYDAFVVPTAEKHRAGSVLGTVLRERLPSIAYHTLPSPMMVPLVFAGVLALGGRRWVLWCTLPAFVGAYALFAYFIPNYIAVYTAPMVFAALLGIRAIVDAFPRWRDGLTVFFMSATLVACITSLPEVIPDVREDNRPMPTMALSSRLDDGEVMIDGALQRIRQPAIVLFKYRPSNDPHEEPVYTIDAAWPDDSPIIRAHDLGGAKNLELLDYYARRQPDRHVYFFDRGNDSITYAGVVGELWAKLGARTTTRESP